MVCLLGLFFGVTGFGYAQSTREVKNTPKAPAPRYQSAKKTNQGFFLFNLFKKKQTEPNEIEEFRKRMKDLSKRKAKEQKLAEDPQYSNPLYFGHKKPPKKRKNGKKKFCKECGMSH